MVMVDDDEREVSFELSEREPDGLDEVDRANASLGASGRVLVRRSGTEPVVRVLAEAENAADAENLCASIAALVERELG
jgi:phosphoglucosamine mutase